MCLFNAYCCDHIMCYLYTLLTYANMCTLIESILYVLAEY